MTLAEFKNEFKDREGIHFNNAGLAPISKRVSLRATEVLTELGTLGSFVDQKYLPEFVKTRARLAEYLGAEPAEVAYFQNCGAALSQLALAMPLGKGDRVVTLDQEYASNYYPWKVACARAGADLITVKSGENAEVSMDALLEQILSGVKCVAVSWVQFQTGSVLDLKKLGEHCRSVGAKLVVDGIQGIGQLPISFRDLPIDALVGGSHKWLCSLNGQAYMAIKSDWLKELEPLSVGAGTFNRFGNFAEPGAPMELTARKFEPGGLSFISLFSLESAMALQLEVGVQNIAQEISRLTATFRQNLNGLSSKGLRLATPIQQAGGITSFKLPIAAEAQFFDRCKQERVAVIKRGEFIRTSLHAFNNESEINFVLELLEHSLNRSQ